MLFNNGVKCIGGCFADLNRRANLRGCNSYIRHANGMIGI